jgi:succinate dehydrogenase/fumarate reductase cytochrome b subunit
MAINKRQIHHATGVWLAVFIFLHLVNHLTALAGPNYHLGLMEQLRVLYRNPVMEALLLAAVALQIVSGLGLAGQVFRLKQKNWRDRLHLLSGLYLAFFLLIHVGAVLAGRWVFQVDTNLYFGAAGLNQWPYVLFFGPYYGLAVVAFFTHVACIHYWKARRFLARPLAKQQGIAIGVLGVVVALAILYGLTNGFQGLAIPAEYRLGNP